MKLTYSMTEGKITKSILLFAVPILIGNVFQQLYNVVDTAIIGNVLGDSALAAVGASSSLYSLVISFANGISSGFSVVLARAFGARDEEQMKRVVALIYVLTIGLAVLLTVFSMIFLRPLLVLLKTPDTIIDRTDSYLRIILAFAAVTMFYNSFSGLLRAIGNSRTPLIFLIISSLINVVLDIVFVKYSNMGIAGAAYATVIAQVVSVILCIIYIQKKCEPLRFCRAYFCLDKSVLKGLLSMGFSMGMMYIVVSIGSVAMQRGINSLGEDIIAAHTAGRKIDDTLMLTFGTLSTAASTFVSQNLGAGHIDRIYKGVRNTILLAFGWSVFSILVAFLLGNPLIVRLSGSSNPAVLATANQYLRINVAFFPILGILLVLRCSLQGIGHKLVPVLGSVVELVFKVGSVGIITKTLGYFGVCILEPVIWCISAVLVSADFLIFLKKTKERKQKKRSLG